MVAGNYCGDFVVALELLWRFCGSMGTIVEILW